MLHLFPPVKGQLISTAIYGLLTSPKKWTNEFVFYPDNSGNTWNLNFDFKFQVFPSRQDRKIDSFVCFLGEVTAWQFCFEIYWPLSGDSFFILSAKFDKFDNFKDEKKSD